MGAKQVSLGPTWPVSDLGGGGLSSLTRPALGHPWPVSDVEGGGWSSVTRPARWTSFSMCHNWCHDVVVHRLHGGDRGVLVRRDIC